MRLHGVYKDGNSQDHQNLHFELFFQKINSISKYNASIALTREIKFYLVLNSLEDD